ncbi:MAG TPA: PAS domain-containing protein [Stellaceae bacterium]|nr:PAS domain-containing protein [Stellaceae bacterium]
MTGVLQGEPLLRAVYDFYVTRCGGRAMPRRADIDPVDMPRFVLPYLVLLDIFDGGARFRWRLAGTEVVNRFGHDATGRFGEEVLSGDYLVFVSSLIQHACRRRMPVYSHAIFRWEEARTLSTSRLYLPLGDEAGVTQILGAHDFGTKASRVRNPATLLRDARHVDELIREELPFCQQRCL